MVHRVSNDKKYKQNIRISAGLEIRTMLPRTFKLILGIILLLVVDIIWVTSSELTKYLYQNENYDKPFFCTYFKTSLFTLYLFVAGIFAPWRQACERNTNNDYTLVDQNNDDENYYTNGNALSDSTFVPIKAEQISGAESDDSSVRSVRFSKLAEVREMSAHEATEALLSRLSYAASLRVRSQSTHNHTARTALLFCILWFIANYLFQLALEPNEAALVTLLSSTSSFFTLVLAALYPSSSGDRLTLSKALAVIVSIAGVIMVTFDDVRGPQRSQGIAFALLSAFFYASYLVLVKHKSDNEEKIDIPLFFGFVGLWNLILLWPVFFILHFTGIEEFELPNENQFLVLLINGLIGTVLSEALWLWCCFLTSSLIGTIGVTLQIPLAMLFDVTVKGSSFPPSFYMGTVPVCGSLIFVGYLTTNDDSDPLLRFVRIVYRKMCNCQRAHVVRITDLDEQQESLIGNHD